MTSSEITSDVLYKQFDFIHTKYQNESYRTLWELYCDYFDVDYENEEIGEIFDSWVDNNFVESEY